MAALEEFILTSEIVSEISEKENLGRLLKRHEKLWFSNIRGIRKAGVTFAMTDAEFGEYVKSKMSVNYFAEKYCKIKLEDGIIGNMKLRNYQKDIMDLYTKNRYFILMASRQTGKCNSFNTSVLLLDEITKEMCEVPFCEVYYNTIEQVRKLKVSERLKLFLYRLYIKIS